MQETPLVALNHKSIHTYSDIEVIKLLHNGHFRPMVLFNLEIVEVRHSRKGLNVESWLTREQEREKAGYTHGWGWGSGVKSRLTSEKETNRSRTHSRKGQGL